MGQLIQPEMMVLSKYNNFDKNNSNTFNSNIKINQAKSTKPIHALFFSKCMQEIGKDFNDLREKMLVVINLDRNRYIFFRGI
jgi:hypothetical protein